VSGVIKGDLGTTSTAGSDTFNATTATLNAFDNINGGSGTDTLNVDDTATGALASFSGVTLSSIEKIALISKLGLLGGALDTSVAQFSGLTDLSVSLAAAAAGQTVTASTTTGVTVSSPAAQTVTVVGGGKTADVTGGGAAVTVGKLTADTIAATDANAYTAVTVRNTGANAVKVADNSGASAAIGSTLTDVTVRSAGAVTLEGKGIVNVTADASSGAITLINGNTAAHALNVTFKGSTSTVDDNSNLATSATINSAAGAAAATVNATTLAGTKLASLAISGAKALTLTSTLTKLATVTISGAGGVSSDLSADGATTTAGFLTSVDTTGSTAAASTANGTIANAITINAGTQYIGGAGVDNVSVATAANAASIALGAGNDSVTIAALSAATSGAIDGGEGIDTLKMTSTLAATVAAATTNGKLSNFERLGLVDETTTSNTDIGRTVEMGWLSGVSNYVQLGAIAITGTKNQTAQAGDNPLALTLTINSVATGATVDFAGAITSTNAGTGGTATSVVIGVKDAAFNTTDTLNIKLSNTAAAARDAGLVTVANVETINIDASTSAATFAAATDVINLVATAAKTLVVTGNQGLNLSSGVTNTALTSIDASAMTGAANVFTYTTGALVAVTTGAKAVIKGTTTGVNTIVATAALKGVDISVGGTANTAANALTGSALADNIAGGAGDDTITSGGGLDSLTGNGGSDTFAIPDGSGTASSSVVITDFVRTATAGTNDKLSLTGTEAVGADALAGWTVSAGVYTKAGASLADFYAAAAANFSALATGAFENGGNTYVFYEGAGTGGTDDVFIQLTGVTGITSLHATTAGANVLVI